MRQNSGNGTAIRVKGMVGVNEGGTGVSDPKNIGGALGFVERNSIGQPGGPIPIDNDGKINARYLTEIPATGTEVEGPATLLAGEVGQYKITNFDSWTLYEVEAVGGQAILQGDMVIYRAPDEPMVGSGFKLNGEMKPVATTRKDRVPNTPVVTTPAADISLNQDFVIFGSSAWSTNYPEDALSSVEWKTATTADFSQNATTTSYVGGALTHRVDNILPNTAVYARVRHKGRFGDTSAWSAPRRFSRPQRQSPNAPTFIQPSLDGEINTPSLTFKLSAFSPTGSGDVLKSATYQMAFDPAFTQIVDSVTAKTTLPLEWPVTFPTNNKDYYVRAKVMGSLGWESDWSAPRRVLYRKDAAPGAPTIVAPANNGMVVTFATSTSEFLKLVSSVFVPSENNAGFKASVWQFARSADATVPDFTITKPDSLSFVISVSGNTVLNDEAMVDYFFSGPVFVRVAHTDSFNFTSAYSAWRTLFVVGRDPRTGSWKNSPKIYDPVPGSGVSAGITFSADDPTWTNGAYPWAPTNKKTVWKLATDSTMVNVIESFTSTTVHDRWTPTIELEGNTDFYLQLERFDGTTKYQQSDVVKYTVLDAYLDIFGNAGNPSSPTEVGIYSTSLPIRAMVNINHRSHYEVASLSKEAVGFAVVHNTSATKHQLDLNPLVVGGLVGKEMIPMRQNAVDLKDPLCDGVLVVARATATGRFYSVQIKPQYSASDPNLVTGLVSTPVSTNGLEWVNTYLTDPFVVKAGVVVVTNTAKTYGGFELSVPGDPTKTAYVYHDTALGTLVQAPDTTQIQFQEFSDGLTGVLQTPDNPPYYALGPVYYPQGNTALKPRQNVSFHGKELLNVYGNQIPTPTPTNHPTIFGGSLDANVFVVLTNNTAGDDFVPGWKYGYHVRVLSLIHTASSTPAIVPPNGDWRVQSMNGAGTSDITQYPFTLTYTIPDGYGFRGYFQGGLYSNDESQPGSILTYEWNASDSWTSIGSHWTDPDVYTRPQFTPNSPYVDVKGGTIKITAQSTDARALWSPVALLGELYKL